MAGTRPPPPLRDSSAWPHGCLIACLALVALPVLAVDYPPVFDYANHLARAHVLAALDGSEIFRSHFRPGGILIPNMLADAVVLALMPAVGVAAAGKALLLLTFVLTLTGVYAVNRQVAGEFSPWPLAAAMLLYNEGFFWGFLNYNLGLGLMLWGLACWLALARRSLSLRLACATLLALAVFLSHLVAFGLFAVAVAVAQFCRIATVRPGWCAALGMLAEAAAPFILPLALFAAFSPSAHLALAASFDFSVFGKIMPFARVLSSGNPGLDGASLALLAGGVGVAVACGWARCLPLPLAVAATFTLLVLTLPFSMLGSYFLDSRIVVAALLAGLAALAPGRRPPHPAWVTAAVLALVAVRSGGLVADWRWQDRSYHAVIAALDTVPVGSVVVTGIGYRFELGDWVVTRRVKPSHEHTTLYATIRRSVLVPNIFARAGQNTLVFQSPLAALGRAAANPVARVLEIGDARWLVQQVLPIADGRASVRPAIPAVYVMGYGVPCSWWPVDMPVRVAVCTDEFSLVEVLGGITEPLP